MPTHEARFFVLRAPTLPVDGRAEDGLVREALRIAAPALLDAVDRAPDDPGVAASVHRYLVRMRRRPTPYGLFASVAVGDVGATTRLELGGLRRHVRIDGEHLATVADALTEELRDRLAWQVNNSLVRIGPHLRFAAARVDPTTRTRHHDLRAVEALPAVDQVLAAAPADRATLAAAIPAADPAEALAFVDQLIDIQVLVSPLRPPVTGPDALRTLADAIRPHPRAAALDAVDAALTRADYDGALAHLGPVADPARLFQVDLHRDGALSLGPRPLALLHEGVDLLRTLCAQPDPLRAFCEAYDRRWQGEERRLVEVLDEEAGIGFGPRRRDASPLLDGIDVGAPTTRDVRFGAREAWILRRLFEVGADWDLDARDRAALAVEAVPLPDSYAVMATFAAADAAALDRGEGQVWIQGASGPPASALLGRFCAGSDALRVRVEEHLRGEEALDPDAIFAEVVHLPEGRLGNILVRPVLRAWELPWLGRGAAPNQLPASDLMISLPEGPEGPIVLRSRALNRRVHPRLSTAHAFDTSDQPLYRFLGALQGHRTAAALAWHWGPFLGLPFLPRVRVGRVILALATWTLDKGDEARLATLPRRVALVDDDNVLPLDREDPLGRAVLLHAVRTGKTTLREVWPDDEALCVVGPTGRHTHEVVVPFLRREPRPPPRMLPLSSARHAWRPGSPWLYAKLRCGTVTADELLAGPIAALIARERPDRWFFLRYADPEPHLRLRIHTADPGGLLGRLHAALPEELRVELDTYLPEVERYGGAHGIDVFEAWSCADSDAVLGFTPAFLDDSGNELRWRLALQSVAALLADAALPVDHTIDLLAHWRRHSAALVGVDKRTEGQLSARARALRGEVDALVDAAPTVFAERTRRAPVARLREGPLDRPLAEVLGSWMHMAVNRMVRGEPNLHEVVIYDLLLRARRSARARSRDAEDP